MNVATVFTPPAGEEPKPQLVTYEQLAMAILQEAGLDPDEMEALRRTVKMPGGWEVGKPAPAFPQTHVIDAMFSGEGPNANSDHVPGDIRVYARPLNFTDTEGEPSPFFLFVFNRTSQASRTDAMNLQSFIEQVGAEYAALVVEEEDDEEEDEPTLCSSPTCDAELPEDARFCHRCATPVRRCGACGHVGESLDKFCASCGVPLPPVGAGR
jgi:hypothetical protein